MMNLILLSTYILSSNVLEGSNVIIKNNDMTLESLANGPTTDIISCINDAIEANIEKYIDMIYFELFSNYIDNPCDEIKEIWFDNLDIVADSNDPDISDHSDVSEFLSELVNKHGELFELIFTWFNNNLFPNDSQSHIRLAVNILSWLNSRKLKYSFVNDWCNPSWTSIGLTEYSNIVSQCFSLGSLVDDIIYHHNNDNEDDNFLIRRLIENKKNDSLINKNESIAQSLQKLQDKCISFVNKGINVAIQANIKISGNVVYPFVGIAATGGIGVYFTLDGVVEIQTYWTLGFGAGIYAQPSSVNALFHVNMIFFMNGNSGEDYMDFNFAAEVGFNVRLGFNGRAIFSWKPQLSMPNNWDVKFLGWSVGLEIGWMSEVHAEIQPILYNKHFGILSEFKNLTKFCEKICGKNGTLCKDKGLNNTMGDLFDDWKNNTINLFDDKMDWWSIEKGEWNIDSSGLLNEDDDNTISTISNTETNSDSIVWIGNNHKESLDWESYSVTVDLYLVEPENKENEKFVGFIFGATDVKNAYFFGITGKYYSFGCYKENVYTKVFGDKILKAKYGFRTIKSILYSNGSVVLYDGIKKLNYEDADGINFFSCEDAVPKGSVGLRTQIGATTTYYDYKVKLIQIEE